MAALTEREQAQIIRHLGYANWSSLASSFQLGYPAASQPEFLVRDAFARIDAEGLELVRRDVRELNCIEDQMSEARSRFKALRLGELTPNQNEIRQLRREFAEWQAKLANDLGAPINPFARGALAGGRNATVIS